MCYDKDNFFNCDPDSDDMNHNIKPTVDTVD